LKTELQITVRALVEYALRSGDLELVFFGSKRSVEGIQAHKWIQEARPEVYIREVPICHEIETETFLLKINGRIDGVYKNPDRIIIDEIKTTFGNLEVLEEFEKPLDWGQVKTYAYLYALDHGLDEIDAQITYYQLNTGEMRELRISFSREELELFFQDLVARYLAWAEKIVRWRQTRDGSIQEVTFPFPAYRPGQRRMAVDVYTTIKKSNQLIAQAATGIGKTIAALFPSIKAMGEGLTSKIFYLTARTTGQAAAEKALDELREHGLKIKSITLTAKDKVCFNPASACTGDECNFAKGFYDRIDEALKGIFSEDAITRLTIEEAARKYRVCPFEFSLEISLWADCIICDYNYVFDPRVYLRRFFLEQDGEYTILIDEAHNLVDRSREMFSAEIRKQPFLDTRRPIKNQLPAIYRNMGRINSWLVKARKRCEEAGNFVADAEQPDGLYPLLRDFLKEAERWLTLNIKTEYREELLDLYFDVNGFMKIAEHYDKSYATYIEKLGKDLRVKLFCIDPSGHLEKALKRCRTSVFFSATMSPIDYFKTILGCKESTSMLELPSPFPRENRCLLISDRTSTLYRQRDKTKSEVALAIHTVVRQRKGNYLLYFPSYEYMMMVYTAFTSECPGFKTIIQVPVMTEDERGEFLDKFGRENRETLVGFAVMGGIFGEGIDLVGERLSGVVIVGVGLPGISPERDIIRDYFTTINNRGFEYAYLYPGINRVFQAAGRLIRTETDRGVILLIDRRFSTVQYRSLFPKGWHPMRVKDNGELGHTITRFWNE
jgi:DNA excision repair protein ERCC-2